MLCTNVGRRVSRSVYVLGAILAVVLLAVAFSAKAQAQTLVASYYGNELAGSPTASGVPFDPYGYTAASLTYPLGTQLRVCYQGCVNVTVNDRGPYVAGRDIDLSLGAAQAIGLGGVAPVDVTEIGSGDTGATSAPAPAPVSDKADTAAPATAAPAEATPVAPAAAPATDTSVEPLIYQAPQTVTYSPSVVDYTTYGTDTVYASGSGAVSAVANAYSYGGTATATAYAYSY